MKNNIAIIIVNFLVGEKEFQFLCISVNAPEQSHQTLKNPQQLDPSLSKVIYLNVDWIGTGLISQWTQSRSFPSS